MTKYKTIHYHHHIDYEKDIIYRLPIYNYDQKEFLYKNHEVILGQVNFATLYFCSYILVLKKLICIVLMLETLL